MKNEPKTNPISEMRKMTLNFYWTKPYENKPPLPAPGNEPNSNPIEPNFRSPKIATSPNYPQPKLKAYAVLFFLSHIERNLQPAGNKIPTLFLFDLHPSFRNPVNFLAAPLQVIACICPGRMIDSCCRGQKL